MGCVASKNKSNEIDEKIVQHYKDSFRLVIMDAQLKNQMTAVANLKDNIFPPRQYMNEYYEALNYMDACGYSHTNYGNDNGVIFILK